MQETVFKPENFRNESGLKFTDFRNESGLKFTDISSEAWREYTFAGGVIRHLAAPLMLNVSKSGGHRVFTADGHCHYIPGTFLSIEWLVKAGTPHFVK